MSGSAGAVRISERSTPALPRGVRLRYDDARRQWVLLAPERLFVLDAVAHAIVSRCDGAATVDEIVDALAEDYAAPREVVLGDVTALLQEFADKRVLTA